MRVLFVVLPIVLAIYALIDCARTPEEEMPAHMPKAMWIMLIVFFAAVGPIAWIIVSRVAAAERRGGTVEATVWSSDEPTPLKFPHRPRQAAPDDDPEFLRSLEEHIHHSGHDAAHSPKQDPSAPPVGQGGEAGGEPDGKEKPGEADQDSSKR